MFGEVELNNEKKLRLNKNGSITLPEFTKAEHNEKLWFFKLSNETRIYSEQHIKILINELLEHYKANHTLKELRDFRRLIYAKSLEEKRVTASKTITIPQDIIENQEFEKEIFIVGANTHLKIFKNIEAYEKYLESKKV